MTDLLSIFCIEVNVTEYVLVVLYYASLTKTIKLIDSNKA